jgi:hypothetical protein
LARVTTRAGLVVAAGRIGKYPADTWTSRDLQHWTQTTVNPQGAIQELTTTPRGFVAAGIVYTTKQPSLGGAPTIWTSPDGRHWREALRLPAPTFARFVGLVTRGNSLLAVGSRGYETRRGTGAFLNAGFAYSSHGGQSWTRTDRPTSTFPTNTDFYGAGAAGDTFIITGDTTTTNKYGTRIPTNALWTTRR